ncbi:MAG: CpsD/CapB family tyrosine-protein kinase [Candidatus Sulfotelmatobacter sp.]
MSHIFDALRRSDADSSGKETSEFSVATELLQAAEQKMHSAAVEGLARERFAGENLGVEITEPPRQDYLASLEHCRALPVTIRSDSRLVSVAKEESLGAEKFRFLAVRLRQLRQNRPLKKILITSTIPQEGKSTVATNLACTLARRKQQRTLLLDGDLRRPAIAGQLGLRNVPGLSEWFHGDRETPNVYRLESLGLWLLPAGRAPENPLELMQSGKISYLIEMLSTWFDWIIIDSPPLLPLADTSIWARLADGILLVTRKGVTEKQQLERGLEVLDQGKLLGALVNDSSDVAHSDYYQRYSPPASSPPARQSKR